MPAPLRPDSVRAAIERATGATVTVTEHPGYVRIAVPTPTEATAFRALLDVLRGTRGQWGSSDGTEDGPRVWVKVTTEVAE